MATTTTTGTKTSVRELAGAAGITMVLIFASRILGLVREMVISGKFGQDFKTDVYNAAFMVPDLLFYLIAGGALSQAFIPNFSEKINTGKIKEGWHLFSTVACILFIAVTLFVIAGEIFTYPLVKLMNYGFDAKKIEDTVALTRIVLPCQIFFFLGGLMSGAQQVYKNFTIPYMGPIVYNIGIICGGVVLGSSFGIAGLCWGALIGCIVGNFFLQMWGVSRFGAKFHLSFDWKNPDAVQVWKMMLPVILGVALPQVSLIINRMFASWLDNGMQSALNNANKLMQVPLAIFAQALSVAIFPMLSKQAALKQSDDFRSTVNLGIRFNLFLTVPASFFMIALALPIVALILQHGKFTAHDSEVTSYALIFYSIGVFAWSAQAVLGRAFNAMKDTRTPVIVGSIITLFFIPMNWLFMDTFKMGHSGLALATTIAAFLNMIVLLFMLRKKLNGIEGRKLGISVGKIVLSSCLAAAACWLSRWGMEHVLGAAHLSAHVKQYSLATILAGLAGGTFVYVLSAFLLKSEELKNVVGLVRRRRKTV